MQADLFITTRGRHITTYAPTELYVKKVTWCVTFTQITLRKNKNNNYKKYTIKLKYAGVLHKHSFVSKACLPSAAVVNPAQGV